MGGPVPVAAVLVLFARRVTWRVRVLRDSDVDLVPNVLVVMEDGVP